jgi:hypothetical protein
MRHQASEKKTISTATTKLPKKKITSCRFIANINIEKESFTRRRRRQLPGATENDIEQEHN